jgi:hypothetical protein
MELNTVKIKENVWWKEGIISTPGLAHSGKKIISNHPEYGELELGIARIEDTPTGIKACILIGENDVALYEVKSSKFLAPNSYQFEGYYLIEDTVDKETVKETVHFVFFKKVKENDSEVYKFILLKGYMKTDSEIQSENSIEGFLENKKEVKNVNSKKVYIDLLFNSKNEFNESKKIPEIPETKESFTEKLTSKKEEKGPNIEDLQYKVTFDELDEMSDEWIEKEDEDAENKQGI